MIWCDRLALVWGGLVFLLFLGVANGHGHPEAALDPEALKAVLLLAGVPWLILRGLVFVVRRY